MPPTDSLRCGEGRHAGERMRPGLKLKGDLISRRMGFSGLVIGNAVDATARAHSTNLAAPQRAGAMEKHYLAIAEASGDGHSPGQIT
jgi:hypothetical protein